MNALVIFDSFFGNTEQVARAIGETLGAQVVKVSDARPDQLDGVELLVVGSPTRAFAASPATMDFLKNLPARRLAGVQVAAFDTRMNVEEVGSKFLIFMAGLFGYGAEKIARALKRKGGTLKLPAEGFFVEGREGPVKPGELERATAWAVKLR